MRSFSALLGLAACLPELVSAHGFVRGIRAGGVWTAGSDPVWFYSPAGQGPVTAGWDSRNQDLGFVEPAAFGTNDIACHKSATAGKNFVNVNAGQTIEIYWNTWPDSHKGPIIDYIAPYNAAAAARINAQLQAKKGIQHVDVPPIRSTSETAKGGSGSPPADNINGEMYVADGDYIKDIEVNDLRNRYLLTKGSTQKMHGSPGPLTKDAHTNRLSRPSLVTQHPTKPPQAPAAHDAAPIPASLAYAPDAAASTNPDPFLLAPILNLPLSFGSAYVGEHFSCTLCANHEPPVSADVAAALPTKRIRDVRIEAEMKTPGAQGSVQKLQLTGRASDSSSSSSDPADLAAAKATADLAPGETLQRIVGFDLKDEGNHVLAVTVSYYEATETSGRTRTFRKLYQFICKSSLIVRTKVGSLPGTPGGADGRARRRWVLEAQLENCAEDVVQLERVELDLEAGLAYTDCNWGPAGKPVLHPGEVEQVCFVVEETAEGEASSRATTGGSSLCHVMDSSSTTPLADYFWIAGIETIAYDDPLPSGSQVAASIAEDGEQQPEENGRSQWERPGEARQPLQRVLLLR
ncbi:Polysaccharide monooxygenase Cel61a like protein [Verticillium longisporum]|uniref:Polysaccharide monooxygenase Cel61a like protein n=2 Tax=Verticillium longisporum TaxID=100787 RepID=A0A8I2ZA96_VERLO|nr:Polysaccharide monooxygenase Cel61a like protein [Verticillium longisporum]